jgi:hypothetical protein
MLSDRKGVAIELAILMTAVCLAVTTIVLSTALLQYENKVQAEQRMEENIIFEQIMEAWLKAPSQNVETYKEEGYFGVSGTRGEALTLDVHTVEENEELILKQKVLTVVAEKIGEKYIITEWKKG